MRPPARQPLLAQPPQRRGVNLAVQMRARNADDQAVGSRVVGVRRRADADRVVVGILGDPVVAIEIRRQGVAHSFADGASRRAGHVADHAPRQPVAVLVVDDVRIEIAVPHRRRLIPQIHLHPRPAAVFGRGKVGVVDGAAVLGLRIERIVLGSAPAEVVRLKVARRFGEPEVVQAIVHRVGQVEQVRDCRVLVGGRRWVGRPVPDEVEDLIGGGRAATEVRDVVVVAIEVGVDVVANRGGADAEPAERRGDRIRGIDQKLLRRDAGMIRKYAIALAVRPQLLVENLAAAGHDRVTQLVGAIPRDHHIARIERPPAERQGRARHGRRMVERSDTRERDDVADARGFAQGGGDTGVIAVEDHSKRVLRTNARRAQRVRRRDEVFHDARQIAVPEARLDVGAVDIQSGHLLAEDVMLDPARLVLPQLHQVTDGHVVMAGREKRSEGVDA